MTETEALDRIRATYADLERWSGWSASGFSPAPGSDLASDDSDWRWLLASQLAFGALSAAGDHLTHQPRSAAQRGAGGVDAGSLNVAVRIRVDRSMHLRPVQSGATGPEPRTASSGLPSTALERTRRELTAATWSSWPLAALSLTSSTHTCSLTTWPSRGGACYIVADLSSPDHRKDSPT